MTSDCMMTVTCYGGFNMAGVDYHCALNQGCVDVNGKGVCVKGTLFEWHIVNLFCFQG